MGIQKVALLLVILLAVALTGCKSDSSSTRLVESEVKSQVESEISKRFNDPGSTRFRHGGFSSYDPEERKFVDEFIPGATSLMYCGEVNGKNRFGSFSGFTRFAALYSPPLDSESGPDIDIVFDGNHQFASFSRDCP